MKLYFLFPILILAACVSKPKEVPQKNLEPQKVKDSTVAIKLSKVDLMHVVGDFDGDGKIDTIYEYLYSDRAHSNIDSAPNGYNNDWDTVVSWFYHQEVNVVLKINKKGVDSLNLERGEGFFFLQNIGDNNQDGKDEIALVIDNLGYSSVNSCGIYTLCGRKLKCLKAFSIHESAFESDTESSNIPTNFKGIHGFLEQKGKCWYYLDYALQFEENEEMINMRPLKLPKCK